MKYASLTRTTFFRHLDTQLGVMNVEGWCCHTLEPLSKQVETGIYACKWVKTPKHPQGVCMLQHTGGMSGVEIHVGNFRSNTDGCILLGDDLKVTPEGDIMITESAACLEEFLSRIAPPFYLSITDVWRNLEDDR